MPTQVRDTDPASLNTPNDLGDNGRQAIADVFHAFGLLRDRLVHSLADAPEVANGFDRGNPVGHAQQRDGHGDVLVEHADGKHLAARIEKRFQVQLVP